MVLPVGAGWEGTSKNYLFHGWLPFKNTEEKKTNILNEILSDILVVTSYSTSTMHKVESGAFMNCVILQEVCRVTIYYHKVNQSNK